MGWLRVWFLCYFIYNNYYYADLGGHVLSLQLEPEIEYFEC